MAHPRPRLVLAAALCLALLIPAHASAQVPVQDTGNTLLFRIEQMAERFAEWYMTGVQWRDATVGKAREMQRRTRQVTRIRHRYESMAAGELGRLGNAVPDWREYANHCDIEVGGISACTVDRHLARQFEDVLEHTFYRYRGDVFDVVGAASEEIDLIVGSTVSSLSSRIDGIAREGGRAPTAMRSRAFVEAQAEGATALENSSRYLTELVDSVMLYEVEGREISSGRAQQLSAHLAWAEASVDLALARSRMESLDRGVVDTAETIRGGRMRAFARHASAARN